MWVRMKEVMRGLKDTWVRMTEVVWVSMKVCGLV